LAFQKKNIVFANKEYGIYESLKDILSDDVLYLDPLSEVELEEAMKRLKLDEEPPFIQKEQKDPFRGPPKIVMYLPPPVQDKTKLNLSGRVFSKVYKGKVLTRLIPADELVSKLKTLKEVDFSTVTEVDLTRNQLNDDDLPHIYELATLLPKCAVIDISHNRFHGLQDGDCFVADKALFNLLELKQIKLVVIIGNALATRDREDLFKKLEANTELLAKLVWIPKVWLSHEGWKALVTNPSAQIIVTKVHMEYFETHKQ